MRDAPAEALEVLPPEAAAPSPKPRRLRLKLLAPLTAAACGILVCALAAAALVSNARDAVERELDSAFELTRVNVAMRMPPPLSDRDTLEEARRLAEEVDARRHVSAVVASPAGYALSRVAEGGGEDVPQWFLRMLTPEPKTEIFAVTHYPNVLGTLRISTDPRDEIEEVWEDFRVVMPALALAALALAAATALFNVFVLSRIEVVTRAVERMRGGDLAVRAPEGRLEEVARLAEGVNALARHLQAGRAENASLQRRLLSLSEEERARIASDLHDEIGPQIFGLQAAARQAGDLARKGAADPALAEALEAVARHAAAVQRGARAAISDLRPMAAGDASLAELLQELVADFSESHPGLELQLEADPLAAADELREIAIYRFVRESLLNALRHGGAKRVWVAVSRLPAEGEAPAAILAQVRDDGRGPKSGDTPHLGHIGMRDRARALDALWTPPRREGRFTLTELRTPCRPTSI